MYILTSRTTAKFLMEMDQRIKQPHISYHLLLPEGRKELLAELKAHKFGTMWIPLLDEILGQVVTRRAKPT